MKKKSAEDFARKEVQAQFPLRSRIDYNFYFENGTGWPVATVERAPSDFKKRLAAAKISYNLQISPTYAMKQYLHGIEYEDLSETRLDSRIKLRIEHISTLVHETINLFPGDADVLTLGAFISEWWTARIRFSLRILLECIDFGSLFESAAISRALLEQLAWADAARDEPNDSKIFEIKAQSGISRLKKLHPKVGRYYGWLSEHTHWVYDAHYKSFRTDDDQIKHQFASSHFKMISLLSCIVLTNLISIFFCVVARAHHDVEGIAEKLAELEEQNTDLSKLAQHILDLSPDDSDVIFLFNCLR